jgi:HAD superfamily hydrolase (TIGR01509 family)
VNRIHGPRRPLPDSADDLTERFRRVGYVCFDFDGPICDLFAERPAAAVARNVVETLRRRGDFPDGLPKSPDPHALFRLVRDRAPRGRPSPLAIATEQQIAAEERRAARTAAPTPGVHELVKTLAERDIPLAITSNNSAEAIADYLLRVGLSDHFGGRILGRRPEDSTLMKPHPDCIERALVRLAVPAGARHRCLLIGDSPADAAAARGAGVPCVGFVPERHSGTGAGRAGALIDAGAELTVRGMGPLLDAFSRI